MITTLDRDGDKLTQKRGAVVQRDAYVVELLRQQGAIILGKAALSQWAFFRSAGGLPSGWSSTSGQIINPWHATLEGNPSGSSGGSAVATVLGLCAASLYVILFYCCLLLTVLSGSETFGRSVQLCSRFLYISDSIVLALYIRAITRTWSA